MSLGADSKAPAATSRRLPLLIGLLFLALVAAVNPFRAMPTSDDWAYAWSVERWRAGEGYRQHDWLCADYPFLVLWGSLITRLPVDIFSALRLSTLALLGAGLWWFYRLMRECQPDRELAGLLALAWLCSPLLLRTGFSFLSDVPFLACLVGAVYFYVKGLRRRQTGWMLAGGAVAAAAVLIRLHGAALPAALGALWLLQPGRRRNAALCLSGIVPPALAAAWVAARGWGRPSLSLAIVRRAQAAHLADVHAWLPEALSRPAVILQYLCLFTLPLAGLAAVGVLGGLWRGRRGGAAARATGAGGEALWKPWLLPLCGAAVAAGLYAGHRISGRPLRLPSLPWSLMTLEDLPAAVSGGLTLLSAGAAGVLLYLLFERYGREDGWRRLLAPAGVLDLVSLCFAGQLLGYYKLADRYLLPLLPYTILALGLRSGRWLRRWAAAFVGANLLVAAAVVVWTRGELNMDQAWWQAAETVRLSGVPAERIVGPWTWMGYHRFDEFQRQRSAVAGSGEDAFLHWAARQEEAADYVLVSGQALAALPEWRPVLSRRYRDELGRERTVWIVRRPPAGTPEGR